MGLKTFNFCLKMDIFFTLERDEMPICIVLRNESNGGARGGPGGYSPPSEGSSPPVGGNCGSRRRNFSKITHGNTIF